jgi:hypothetical protein
MSVQAHLTEKSTDHRRHRRRQERHAARIALRQVVDGYVDADDLVLPVLTRDVGKHRSPKPPSTPKPGRRVGFKVWKTPFWKRRYHG